ncbi:amino acid transporter [Corynebacterium diphtheriae]|nr:amino acid transporter [Corynebacterium diphtheriae]CAB0827471.1 amino acid transporter [Corynebacterium diphtheriae]CAB0855962.1 amino acid transporter [Corynebacterium diphtheriae]
MLKLFDAPLFRTLKRRQEASTGTATIDVAAAPALVPIAPVDLTDRGQVTGVLEIAARIGEILIVAGTTNSDASRQVSAVTESFGLWNCHVDMTSNRIRLFANVSDDRRNPVAVVRIITPAAQNFRKLILVDRLIRDIHSGKASPINAETRLDAIDRSKDPMGLFGFVASFAVMSGAVALLLGGDIPVALISTLAGGTIMWMSAKLGDLGLPIFFQNTAGGIFVAILATVAYKWGLFFGLQLRPSMIIATSIIVMVAGLTLVQAIQNGVTAAPISGTARLFDAIIITAGIVAGIAIGASLAAALGYPLPPVETLPVPNLASQTVRVIGSTLASAAFARSCYADWPSVVISGVTAMMGSSLFYFVLVPTGVNDITATATTAVIIGLVGGLLGRRYQIPPLVISIAGITPLLPGSAIYRGLFGLLNEQILVGFSNLTYAFAAATALSAGVVFGEWIARRLRRPPSLAHYRKVAVRIMRARRRNVFD